MVVPAEFTDHKRLSMKSKNMPQAKDFKKSYQQRMTDMLFDGKKQFAGDPGPKATTIH